MSTLEDLDDLEREQRDKKRDDQDGDGDGEKNADGDAEMKDADAKKKEEEEKRKEEEEGLFDEEILSSSTADIVKRRRMLENELRIMRSEYQRLMHEQNTMRERVKDNQEKVENNRYAFLRGKYGGGYDRDMFFFGGWNITFTDVSDNYRTSSETSSNYWT